jgi:uncharacterized membrane protein YdjX (TVP38/TMEM64 family)
MTNSPRPEKPEACCVPSAPRRRSTFPWPCVVAAILALTVLTVPIIIWHEQITAFFAQRAQLVTAVQNAGTWGPLVIAALTVAQIIAAPIPGQVVNFAAGYLYGLWPGVLLSWSATVLGSTLAMALARWGGRPLVTRLVRPKLLARLDRQVAGRGLGFFFLVFLIPGLPDDVTCFLAGLTSLPLPALIVAAAIGRFPGIVASVWAGAYTGHLSWQGWLILGGATLSAGIIAWRYTTRIQDAILRRLTRR